MSLRLSSVGVRGFVGQSLTPRVAMDVASAFGTYLDGGDVLVGRDTRQSSDLLHAAAVASLLACGCRVVDLGICPAPILQFCVPRRGAAGAIAISGGHHGPGWNSLTLIGRDGAVLEPSAGEAVLDVYHGGAFRRAAFDGIAAPAAAESFEGPYFAALAALVDRHAIAAAAFTVLIDPVGGAGCAFLEGFARALGFNLVGINAQPSAYLAREPEPRPRSATQMASIIRHVSGHVGFLLTSDMGRLSIVTEDGEPASEEASFALVAEHVLRQKPGAVVTNCCTSRTIDDIAARHGVRVVKTAVGQAHVVAALADEGGRIGGEGSGGGVLPGFSRAFDGFLMMALVLEFMAVSRQPVSALLRDLPRYHITKRSIPCHTRRVYHILEHVRASLERDAGARTDFTDGIRADWPDGWVHVRASHTEQIIRVISEDRNRDVALERADRLTRLVEQEIL